MIEWLMGYPMRIVMAFIFFIICTGLGGGAFRFARLAMPQSWFPAIWSGVGVLVFYLMLWHLFFPVDKLSLIIPCGISLLGWIRIWKNVKISSFQKGMIIPVIFLILFFGLKMAETDFMYDSLVYHFQTIRWYEQYAIIPGHANLLIYFGFNQSWFLLGAFLNALVGSPTGVFILNGSFLGLAAIEWIFRFRFAVVNRNTMLMLFSIGSLLLLFRSVNLSSPSPDVLVTIITLQVLGIGITKYLKGQFQTIRGNYLLWILSWGVACKLSLSGLLLGWILYLLFITSKKNIQPKIILGCLLIGGIFIIRGIILSGYPLFPTQLLGLDLIWKVPQEKVQALSDFIKGFARTGTHGYWTLPEFQDGSWIHKWIQINRTKPAIWIGIIGFIAWIIKLVKTPKGKSRIQLISFCIPLLALIIWFWAAPDVRFANALLWGVGLLGVGLWLPELPIRWKISPWVWISLPCLISFIWIPLHPQWPKEIPQSACISQMMTSGWKVNTPAFIKYDDWRIATCALPTSVRPDSSLRMIGTTFQQGFFNIPKPHANTVKE